MSRYLYSFINKNTDNNPEFIEDLQQVAEEFGLTLEEVKLCAMAFTAERLEEEYGVIVR